MRNPQMTGRLLDPEEVEVFRLYISQHIGGEA